MCRTAYSHLRNIRSLKPYLTHKALLTVTHAFITSRINYCNSLLYCVSDYNIRRLQKIQNCAARIITNTKRYDNITQVLRKLHWSPVRYRIQYKILLIIYKAITGMTPDYLCSLTSTKTSARSLRSSKQIVLHILASKLKSYGNRSFSVTGPVLWNRLLESATSAKTMNHSKSLLKTYIFHVAFNLYVLFYDIALL